MRAAALGGIVGVGIYYYGSRSWGAHPEPERHGERRVDNTARDAKDTVYGQIKDAPGAVPAKDAAHVKVKDLPRKAGT